MEIKKYLSLYKTFFSYALIADTTYRVTFIVGLLIEFGYQLILIFLFRVIYANTQGIAGWSYNEVLFLVGVNIISSELLLGLCYIRNLRHLPEKVRDGSVDFVFLKPVNSLFTLGLSAPITTSLFASISGFFLIYYAANQLAREISLINAASGVFILLCGLIIGYSILVMFASLTFKFLSSESIPKIGEEITIQYKQNPHQIYEGFTRLIFFFIFPVVFIGSIPASTIIRGIELQYIFLSPALATVFLFLAVKMWDRMTMYYSSASS